VRRLLAAEAVDLVNVDASECGGVTEWRRAAAMAQGAGARMAHHEESQIAQHLLAGVPDGPHAARFADPDRVPAWQAAGGTRPAAKNGTIELSPGPGFGLALDDGMIRTYRVA